VFIKRTSEVKGCEVVDWGAFSFAFDAFIMVLGYLMMVSFVLVLFAFSALLVAYSIGEAISQWRRSLRMKRERKMWSEIGAILETSGFDDEEGGDECLAHM
jgi:hypothetical protein